MKPTRTPASKLRELEQLDARSGESRDRIARMRTVAQLVPREPDCTVHNWCAPGPGRRWEGELKSLCPHCQAERDAREDAAANPPQVEVEVEVAYYQGKPASAGEFADAVWLDRRRAEEEAGRISPGSQLERAALDRIEDRRIEFELRRLDTPASRRSRNRAHWARKFGVRSDLRRLSGPGVKAGEL